MTNKTYYLMRHGLATLDTYSDEEKLTKDILSVGVNNIKKMAHFLVNQEIELFFSSPVPRAVSTAELVSQVIGQHFYLDNRIREEYHESFVEIKNRLMAFITEINKREEQRILLSTHGVVVAGITHLLTTTDFTLQDENDFLPTASLRIIEDNEIIDEKVF